MVEHPLKQDFLGSQDIAERIQVQEKEITQQYADFRLNINEYTMSNWHGLRASQKIVLGAFWKGFGTNQSHSIMDVAQEKNTPCKWRIVRKAEIIIFCIFCVTFFVFWPYFADIGQDFVESVKS